MNENKTELRGMIILAIIVAVYSVAVFALPFPKAAVFWLSYLFTLASLGAQIYVSRVAFSKGKDAKSRFYGFPIARIGVVYLLAQFALGVLFMALAALFPVPVWMPMVLYLVLMGIAAVGFIATDVMRDEIERQDTVLKANVSTMRALQSKAAFIAGQCEDSSTKMLLQKLSNAFRYSDPVSSDATFETEANLASYIDELQSAVMDRDYHNAGILCSQIETTLAERNRLCKVSK